MAGKRKATTPQQGSVWPSIFLATAIALPGLSPSGAGAPFPAQLRAAPPSDARKLAREHNQRGIAWARQGHHREAMKEFRLAVRLRPGYAEARYNLGIELDHLDELDEAIEAFRRAAQLRPDSAPIRLALALALMKNCQRVDAIPELRQAIELDPNLVDAHFNLGLVLGQQGDLEGAVAEFRDTARRRPDFGPARLRLAIALRRQGKQQEALVDFGPRHASCRATRKPTIAWGLPCAPRARPRRPQRNSRPRWL